MVRTLVISDEVAPELSTAVLRDLGAELVLSAGDLPWDYVEWVGDTVGAPVVFVPGNHDPETRPHRDPGLRWEEGPPGPRGVIDADRQVVNVGGLRIAGLGGCVRYRSAPHQYSQREFARQAARLVRSARRQGPLDVLLTHAPPYHLGDEDDQAHIGIKALHTVLERLEPTWLLHGHVHPFGRTMPDRHVGRTTVRNVIPWRMLEINPRGSGATHATTTVAGGSS
jgi:Icc-related predicted phosphoesterase